MNRIDQTFLRLKVSERKGVIAYLTAGDPDLKVTGALVLEMASKGIDMVELGVPFSDPVADGPVIQAASERALKNGITLEKVMALAAGLRPRTGIPILLMSYYNPILQYGPEKFVSSAVKCGIDGVVVPDLPLEESKDLRKALADQDIHLIYFLSPASSPERIEATVKQAQGFIYCVSVTGVTGVREEIPKPALQLLAQVRSSTRLPLALGFGISSSQQIGMTGDDCDAVIIGSAIMKIIENGSSPAEIIDRVKAYIDAL